MCRRSGVAFRVIALIAACALAGCATKIRNVPNMALAKQSTTVVERDRTECEKLITGKVKGVWFPAELEYAACMIARNYQVYVQVLDASVEVRKASLPVKFQSLRVLTDLTTCEHVVEHKVSVVEMIGRPAVAIAGMFFWPASLGGMAASATLSLNRERDYRSCMEPRGYLVTAWQPTTSAAAPTTPKARTAEP